MGCTRMWNGQRCGLCSYCLGISKEGWTDTLNKDVHRQERAKKCHEVRNELLDLIDSLQDDYPVEYRYQVRRTLKEMVDMV
jgi:hypothetical protein